MSIEKKKTYEGKVYSSCNQRMKVWGSDQPSVEAGGRDITASSIQRKETEAKPSNQSFGKSGEEKIWQGGRKIWHSLRAGKKRYELVKRGKKASGRWI